MSGVASRGLVLKNAPDVPAAIVSGPLRNAAYCTPAITRRTGLLTTSLSVMLCVQRITIRTCMMILQIVADAGRIQHDVDAVLASSRSAGPTPESCSSCGEL